MNVEYYKVPYKLEVQKLRSGDCYLLWYRSASQGRSFDQPTPIFLDKRYVITKPATSYIKKTMLDSKLRVLGALPSEVIGTQYEIVEDIE